jgi:transcriptional regulator with XRE-family HTH domain
VTVRVDDFFGEMAGANPEIAAVAVEVDPPFILAGNVYRLRTALGLTQAQLAERIGVRQPRIAEIERGDANPRLDTLARLSAALRVPLAALLADEGASTRQRKLSAERRTA